MLRSIVFGLMVFCSVVAASNIDEDLKSESCKDVKCGVGRECVLLDSGLPGCTCRRTCAPSTSGRTPWTSVKGTRNKRRRSNGVCGTDDRLYESKCELYRFACLNNAPELRARVGKGRNACKRDPLAMLKQKLARAEIEVRQYQQQHIVVPDSCNEMERDRMRLFVIAWLRLRANRRRGLNNNFDLNNNDDDVGKESEEEKLIKLDFLEADEDGDKNIDALEWLVHLRGNISANTSTPSAKKIDRQRLLCLDALVEEGDRNQDWRLNEDEYLTLLKSDYRPSHKYCVMDKRRHSDGTRTKVDCNGCVCSCGKWICTSFPCGKEESEEDRYSDNVALIDF